MPDTLSSCLTGVNNSYEFYTWCKGTSPTAYRTVAYCADGDAVLGVEYADGSGNLSYANCDSTDSLDSTLNTGTGGGWGILLCSNSNGAGTYQGYYDRSGDISCDPAVLGRRKHHNRRHHAVRLQHGRRDCRQPD